VAYPGVWLFVVASALVHVALARSARRGGEEVGRWRSVSWGAGVLALWIALDWPVGALGAGYLASVHMAQFLLIALLAPPFLLLGVPDAVWRRLEEARWLLRLLRVVTHPLAALGLFAVLVAWTHWPPVVDGLMSSQAGSFALDMVWLGTGIVFWWPVVAPVPRRPWLTYPVRMGHLMAATILNTGVFAYLAFSELPLYAVFELAPPISLLSSREDQLLAGLLMKIGGAPILWTAISVLFFRWYHVSRREDAEGLDVSYG